MSKTQYLHELYKAHISDIKNICPDFNGIICPICLRSYSEEAINNKTLTDGHVWPEYLRKKSANTVNQRVLLCKKCNSSAGSRGDSQMQIAEKVREGNKTGNLFGERLINLTSESNNKSVNLKVFLNVENEDQITISGDWNRTNPKDRSAFENLIKQQKPISYVVHPLHDLKPGLARVGWITSAYLYAFYSLGYRYILHPGLDSVRAYIIKSFESENEKLYKELESDDFKVKQYNNLCFNDPELRLIIPLDGKEFIHLETNFLDYQISLPFHHVPNLLNYLIDFYMPDFKDQFPDLKKTGNFLYFMIDNSSKLPTDSIYQYLMGKRIDTKNYQAN